MPARPGFLEYVGLERDVLTTLITPPQGMGSQGQFPVTQNVTVVEGSAANMTCRVDYNDNTSLQWSNPAQQTLFFGDKKEAVMLPRPKESLRDLHQEKERQRENTRQAEGDGPVVLCHLGPDFDGLCLHRLHCSVFRLVCSASSQLIALRFAFIHLGYVRLPKPLTFAISQKPLILRHVERQPDRAGPSLVEGTDYQHQ
ncbi:hypothetical protein P4O66_003237 [Electrophorus voltai]|uniref:Ig-like domain-containing protein n=1 Tax=Electrophorus voltai TaxID=2609070 RepID=A0AAD8YSA5_9TELE|nr:hypothetical protein P4O66_003237 [Electrophorus voltai]